MNKINKIADIEKVEAMTHPYDLSEVVLRDDEEIEELTQEEVLQNTVHKNLTSIIIPKVVKE